MDFEFDSFYTYVALYIPYDPVRRRAQVSDFCGPTRYTLFTKFSWIGGIGQEKKKDHRTEGYVIYTWVVTIYAHP